MYIYLYFLFLLLIKKNWINLNVVLEILSPCACRYPVSATCA